MFALVPYQQSGSISDTFTVNLNVTSGVGSPIQAGFDGGVINNGFADFSNTASLFLVVPPGVTFTSQSGVFLTQAPPAPVPEPHSILMLVTGLTALGMMVRRKRHKCTQRHETC
jgi:hypothetical protein